MKEIIIGCIGALLGFIVGVLLMVGASLSSTGNRVPTVVPPLANVGQPDVVVTLSTAFVNSQVKQVLKQNGLAQQATITFASPNAVQAALVVDTRVAGLTLTVNATATMHVSVRQGRIILTVERVDVAGMGVAQWLISPSIERIRAQAEEEINRMTQRSLQGMSLRVSNIRMTSSDMTVDLVSQ